MQSSGDRRRHGAFFTIDILQALRFLSAAADTKGYMTVRINLIFLSFIILV